MIIFIHGEDTFRSLQRLKILKQGFSKKYDQQAINIISLDGDTVKIDELRKNILSPGLLEKKRCIVIKNIIKNKDKALKGELREIISKKSAVKDNILIFWEDLTVDPRAGGLGRLTKEDKGLIRFLKEQKEERFDRLGPGLLRKWVLAEIKKRGGTISQDALDQLTGSVGQDLWKMNQEIEKLVHYKKDQMITKEDVMLFVQSKFDDNVFLLTDALGQKNSQEALRLFHEQLALGTDPLALLANFMWLIRNLIMIQEVKEQLPPTKIAQELGLHPYVVKKSLPQVQRFSAGELKKIYGRLIKIDEELKTSSKDPKVLFDMFIVEIGESAKRKVKSEK